MYVAEIEFAFTTEFVILITHTKFWQKLSIFKNKANLNPFWKFDDAILYQKIFSDGNFVPI